MSAETRKESIILAEKLCRKALNTISREFPLTGEVMAELSPDGMSWYLWKSTGDGWLYFKEAPNAFDEYDVDRISKFLELQNWYRWMKKYSRDVEVSSK